MRARPVAAALLLLLLVAFLPVGRAVGGSTAGQPNPLCTQPPCAPEITGWLHTEPGSTSFYDSNGNVVPLLGVNDDGLDFGTGNPASSPDSCGKGYGIPSTSFSDIASWGFNFVRVPISWDNLEPNAPTLASNGTWIHHWNAAYLNELDSVVGNFTKVHVSVIWDFAQVDVSPAFQQAPEVIQGGECEGWGNPIWLYPSITSPTNGSQLASAMCSFFNDQSLVGDSAPLPIEAMETAETMLAARYASNPTVIGIDMFNEPWFNSSCGTAKAEGNLLTAFYTKMGTAIEAANPHLVVAFEEPPPGLMSQSPIMTSPPSVPDAVYSFHIYTGTWNAAVPYMQAYLANANKWGVPSWMGEFNDFEAGCTGPNCESIVDSNWLADSNSLLAYCATNGINWSFFSYFSLGTTVATPVPKPEIVAQLRSFLPITTISSSTTSSASTSSTSKSSTSPTSVTSTSTSVSSFSSSSSQTPSPTTSSTSTVSTSATSTVTSSSLPSSFSTTLQPTSTTTATTSAATSTLASTNTPATSSATSSSSPTLSSSTIAVTSTLASSNASAFSSPTLQTSSATTPATSTSSSSTATTVSISGAPEFPAQLLLVISAVAIIVVVTLALLRRKGSAKSGT